MYAFLHTEYFWLLGLVPLIIASMILFHRWRKKMILRMGDEELIRSLPGFPKESTYIRSAVIFLLIFVLIIMALADFTKTAKEEIGTQNGKDIVVLLDVSKSMLANDLSPNRLEAAKELVKNLMMQYPEDRYGLMLFAGNAYFSCPLTTDLGSMLMFLNAATPVSVPAQGSSLETALLKSEDAFLKEQKRQQILILLTDGEDHAQNTLQVAKGLTGKGINLMVVGCGTYSGSTILEEGVNTPKKDQQGKTIVTRLDPLLLTKLAETAGGTYLGYSSTSSTGKQLQQKIEDLEKKGGVAVYNPAKRTHYFQWWLGLAFILLLAELLLLKDRLLIRGWEQWLAKKRMT